MYNCYVMFQLNATQSVPLAQWEDGTIRIAGSRVKLDSIIRQFNLGETAEGIQDCFPSLTLREIYGAIFYYLENAEALEEYLREQRQAAEEGLRFIETHFDTSALRERIRARRAQLAGA